MPLWVALAGSAKGGGCVLLYSDPSTIGLSGSPPSNTTTTSMLTRGMNCVPHPAPLQGCITRIQHELLSSYFPSRSQWNCTRIRACSSTWISSPAGPTTVAVSDTCTLFRFGRDGTDVITAGAHSKLFQYTVKGFPSSGRVSP